MPDTHRSLAIGEVAEQAEMSTSRLRYYERRGLIDPPGLGDGVVPRDRARFARVVHSKRF